MPRTVATAIENNFVKGLITEAIGLKYPENSAVDTYDCIFDVLGSVSRRPGFDYEFGYSVKSLSLVGCAINTYHWKNVSGDGLQSFVVVQVGSTLYFYSSTDGGTSLSGNISSSTINLTTYQAAGSAPLYTYECQFSDGLSKLYVVHPCLENFYVTFDGSNFTATPYTIQIRDFEGVNDGYAIPFRPTTLTSNDLHRYNLYNQGWPTDNVYLGTWHTAESNYPSNADVWWIYNDLSDVFNPAVTVANNTRGNTQAPRGHFILPLYTGDRSTASGLSGINATSAGSARTSSTAFFAGRVWYAGVQATGFNSKIYFSQIIQTDSQIGQCYQACDPTDETLFDLLPSDGGVISIPECGTIYKMFVNQNSLMIFAYRGVWLITGSSGLGFTATDFVVSKMSGVRTTSAASFVDVNGMPMWWNPDGIWVVAPNDSGGFVVNSVTYSTIQTFFDDEIPTLSKTYARGVFNPTERVVTWLYRSTDAATTDDNYAFDRALNLNTLSGAFYPWTIGPGVTVHGVIAIDGSGGISVEDTIIDNAGETVVDDAGDTLVGFDLQNLSISLKTKFFNSIPTTGTSVNVTFSENTDMVFEDWASSGNPVSYESYFITGYKVHAQANKNFQSNYVTVYNEGTGAFYIQGIWDFSLSVNTGRYTMKQLLQFDSEDYFDSYRRPKIRGQGKALQYKFSSKTALGFNIIGWSAFETGNSTI